MSLSDAALEKWLQRSDAKDFLRSRVQVVSSGCWVWMRAVNTSGYGKLSTRVGSKNVSIPAHRLAFLLYRGRIPLGAVVRHTCDTPACCNPDHLTIGSQSENVGDMISRGRKPSTLSEEDVVRIRMRASDGEPQASIARDFPVTKQTVSKIVRRERWRHLG